ncbi:MAG: SURF1 family protein [Actinobacteria bacterium]|nr:SURF1 family protein [Actinomycetota bacterium]
MKGWTFTLSRRWLGYLALVVVFAVACAGLAMWQLARRDEARAEITRVEQNWDSEPRPLAEVVPKLDSFDPDDKWVRVTLTGEYLVDQELLVRGRPLDGNPGFEQLVPFRLADGSVFIVDRGWLPTGNAQDLPDVDPAPPTGPATVVVRLKAGEPTIAGRSAPEGQVATINLAQIAEVVDGPLYSGAYGLLDTENPSAARPVAVSKPVADEGPHLSYAFQWVAFAIMAFIGLGWAVRQEYRIRNADDPEERVRAEARRRKAAAKPKTDAEIEDELLDAR